MKKNLKQTQCVYLAKRFEICRIMSTMIIYKDTYHLFPAAFSKYSKIEMYYQRKSEYIYKEYTHTHTYIYIYFFFSLPKGTSVLWRKEFSSKRTLEKDSRVRINVVKTVSQLLCSYPKGRGPVINRNTHNKP